MKAVVAAVNQEKALVGAFSVITNIRMELFEAPVSTSDVDPCLGVAELAEGPVPSGQWMGESRRVTSTSTSTSTAAPGNLC